MQSTIVRYGVIYGLVGFLIFVIGVLTGILDFSSVMSSILFTFASIALGVTIFVVGLKAYRTENGGFLTFGEAFKAAFGILIIGMVISVVGQYIYTNFIDPDFYDTMADQMQEMLEKFNAPEAQIQESIEQIRNSNSISGILRGLLSGTMMMTIIALIVAAIMKKQPDNPFQNEPLDKI